jgi:hypothetical protein
VIGGSRGWSTGVWKKFEPRLLLFLSQRLATPAFKYLPSITKATLGIFRRSLADRVIQSRQARSKVAAG